MKRIERPPWGLLGPAGATPLPGTTPIGHREHFVNAWINQYRYYGIATSPLEGLHSIIKRWLAKSTNDLLGVNTLKVMLSEQHSRMRNDLSMMVDEADQVSWGRNQKAARSEILGSEMPSLKRSFRYCRPIYFLHLKQCCLGCPPDLFVKGLCMTLAGHRMRRPIS